MNEHNSHINHRMVKVSFWFYIACLCTGILLSLGAYIYRDATFSMIGGDVHAVLRAQDGLDTVSIGELQTYAFKLLYGGPIPYVMLAFFVGALFYSLLGALGLPAQLFPTARHAQKDFDIFEQYTNNNSKDNRSLTSMADKAKLSKGGYLRTRLESLQIVYEKTESRKQVSEENDRLTVFDENTFSFCLLPLEYSVWLLPVLGFIGTVVGVTNAVGGLRLGIIVLFRGGGLSPEVLSQFMEGFRGLLLAFDTTFFGLLGLAAVGTLQFLFQRSASLVVSGVSINANHAINLLKENNRLLEIINTLQQGLLETDEEGQPVIDEGHPVPRWTRAMEKITTALYQPDENGNVSDDSEPVLPSVINYIRKGLFANGNDEGEESLPLLVMLNEMVKNEMFFVDEHGKPLGSRSQFYQQQFLTVLLKSQYNITHDDAENYAAELVEAATGRRLKANVKSDVHFEYFKTYMGALLFHLQQREMPHNVQAVSPNGQPVTMVAISGTEYTAIRNGSHRTDCSEIVTGQITLMGGIPWPNLCQTFELETAVSAYVLNAGRIILADVTRDVMCFSDISNDLPDPIGNLGAYNPQSDIGDVLEVFTWNGYSQVLVPIETPSEGTSIIPLPVDGSMLGGENTATPIAAFNGSLRCMARHGDSCLVMIADNGKNGSDVLFLYSNGKKGHASIPEQVHAIAASPDNGHFWFGTKAGNVGKLDLQGRVVGQAIKIGNLQPIDFIGVTRTNQVIVAQRGQRQLARIEEGKTTVIPLDQVLTSMAVSEDGAHLLVGFQDGSAHYWSMSNGLNV